MANGHSVFGSCLSYEVGNRLLDCLHIAVNHRREANGLLVKLVELRRDGTNARHLVDLAIELHIGKPGDIGG